MDGLRKIVPARLEWSSEHLGSDTGEGGLKSLLLICHMFGQHKGTSNQASTSEE